MVGTSAGPGAAARGLGLLLGEVEAVPGGQDVVDEGDAALLAVGQEVEAGLLLLAEADDGGVVLGLANGVALED